MRTLISILTVWDFARLAFTLTFLSFVLVSQ